MSSSLLAITTTVATGGAVATTTACAGEVATVVAVRTVMTLVSIFADGAAREEGRGARAEGGGEITRCATHQL
jgi:hypothetical protein